MTSESDYSFPVSQRRAISATSETDRLLGEVASDFFERVAKGEQPSVDEYAERYPQIADLIREAFAAVSFIEESLSEHPVQSSDQPINKQSIGDFRILREIGRGGMGVVYEAEQLSLGRSVALKVLPYAAMLDQKAITRFKNEARAAATLDHPNIVPVHAVGNERGIYYYAMALIHGRTLAEVIADLRDRLISATFDSDTISLDDVLGSSEPTPKASTSVRRGEDVQRGSVDRTIDSGQPTERFVAEPIARVDEDTYPEIQAAISTHRSRFSRDYFRSVARLGADIAEALDHAHEHGIVHRDIKPGNLMLDLTGKVWVTDFGLARIESDPGMTMTGDLVGTLRYMAPEQALAKRVVVDHRADIYSLAASLYELLTLRPAFDGRSREELLKQISFEEPPTIPQLNRSVPDDLQTIIHKALSRDPADRYQTAREMADDLDSFAADHPIKARPLSLTQRATRWAVKHRGLVASAGGVLMLAVIGLAISNAIIASERNKARTAQKNEQDERMESDRQRALAEANAKAAREAVDKYLTSISESKLLNVPSLQPLRKELLQHALDYYQKFISERQNDEPLRGELVSAYQRVASITGSIGSLQEALEASSEAIHQAELLVHANPNKLFHQWILAQSYHSRARQRSAMVGKEDPYDDFANAIAILESLTAKDPENLDYQKSLANTYRSLGTHYQTSRSLQDAEKYFRKAIERGERLLQEPSDDPDFKYLLAESYSSLADTLSQYRQSMDEAIVLHLKAIAMLESALGARPAELSYEFELPGFYVSLAQAYRRKAASLEANGPDGAGEVARAALLDASEANRKGIAVYERLVQRNPESVHLSANLAVAYHTQGMLQLDLGNQEPSIAMHRKAIELAESREEISQRLHIALLYYQYGTSLEQAERGDEAMVAFAKAAELEDRVPDESKTAAHWGRIGEMLMRAGQFSSARQALEKCIQIRGETIPTTAGGPRWWCLALCLAHAGEVGQPREIYEVLVHEMTNLSPQNLRLHETYRVRLAKLVGVEPNTPASSSERTKEDARPSD